MRVLHLTTHLNIGGITTYIEKLIKPFAAAGIETVVLSAGGEQEPLFIEKGARIFSFLPRTKNALSPALWLTLPKLLKLLREEKIDLIHAHSRVTQVLGTAAGKLSSIPVVTTAHGFFKKRFGRSLYPCWGARTIAISELVAETLAGDYGLKEPALRVVHNGVDLEELDRQFNAQDPVKARQAFCLKPGDKVIGIISRMVEDKGHAYLIRAVEILKREIPEIRLLIAGEGKHRAELEKLTVELKLQEHVIFTGNLSQVAQALAAMDIFVLPATWREGFGLSVAEAMACRKPVVVTNIPALNKLIEDGVNGRIVEPKDSAALARVIAEILREPAKSAPVIAEARKRVSERYTIQKTADEIGRIYRELFRPVSL